MSLILYNANEADLHLELIKNNHATWSILIKLWTAPRLLALFTGRTCEPTISMGRNELWVRNLDEIWRSFCFLTTLNMRPFNREHSLTSLIQSVTQGSSAENIWCSKRDVYLCIICMNSLEKPCASIIFSKGTVYIVLICLFIHF